MKKEIIVLGGTVAFWGIITGGMVLANGNRKRKGLSENKVPEISPAPDKTEEKLQENQELPTGEPVVATMPNTEQDEGSSSPAIHSPPKPVEIDEEPKTELEPIVDPTPTPSDNEQPLQVPTLPTEPEPEPKEPTPVDPTPKGLEITLVDQPMQGFANLTKLP
ncbi:MAG: hypothetical protein AAF599_00075 [Bacteroidota bacterium]